MKCLLEGCWNEGEEVEPDHVHSTELSLEDLARTREARKREADSMGDSSWLYGGDAPQDRGK